MEFEETLSPTQKIEKENIFKPRCACLQCEFNSKRYANLLRHNRRIHDKKQFQCDFCPKHFVSKKLVRLHIKTHQKCVGTLKNSCPFCGKIFTKDKVLSRHVRIHNNERYHCKQCEKNYSNPGSVRRHVKAVHSDNCFKCDMCGDKFLSSLGNLENHKKMHLKGGK